LSEFLITIGSPGKLDKKKADYGHFRIPSQITYQKSTAIPVEFHPPGDFKEPMCFWAFEAHWRTKLHRDRCGLLVCYFGRCSEDIERKKKTWISFMSAINLIFLDYGLYLAFATLHNAV